MNLGLGPVRMTRGMALLRVALVGCGLISEAHARAYAGHHDRARITVCFDTDLSRAAERADAIGARVASSYEEVLTDPEVDSIELCTPPHLHTDQVIAALEAGKHVSCQKPLARTLGECDAMIEAAERSGRVLFYAEMYRTMGVAVRAREVVESGRIGKLVGIQATYAHWQGGPYLDTPWRYNPKVAGGGQLLDGGIHHIALMRLVGGDVEAASCFTNRIRPELGGDDTATVILRFAEGHLGTLMSTQAAGTWFPGPGFVAFGTEGILTIGGPYGGLVVHHDDLPDRREVLISERADAFGEMVGHFLDVVLDGVPSRATAQTGREDLRTVLAAYRSADEGRSVLLSELP
ncbi:Gfo/Idh/MocA family protein [Fimbriimonas ginsengisoli]|nr:Gfo/Idh/MocA family oxidoreductase [Fimbriimonas ginsengisoli]